MGAPTVVALAVIAAGCGRNQPASAPAPAASGPAAPRHLVLVTIDTLRADHVGVYGQVPSRTPVLDGLAHGGLVADRAFSVAPVTLTSHASLLTGRYPPTHGARHNGVALTRGVPTLATVLKARQFATGAFVAAFPLDRRFGLDAGFDVYGDRWPRGRNGRPADERPGAAVVDEALAWRRTTGDARTFLWLHLFEPHAPYGDPGAGRRAVERYDDEIAEADRQVGRLLDGLGTARATTLVVVTSDHGEAFGEHGEIGHSLFVYDTTLQVPLILQGPGVPQGRVRHEVSLVDVAPTVLRWLQVGAPPSDGEVMALEPAPGPSSDAPRTLYAETFAPFEDFGWSPLRTVRSGGLKFIQAPRPELYDLAADAGETTDLSATRSDDVARLGRAVARLSEPSAPAAPGTVVSAEDRRRLQSLGYLAGAGPAPGRPLADPKDRRALAAQLAAITSGELTGAALEKALLDVLRQDPGNPQAALRLAYARYDAGDCAAAVPHFRAAIRARMPSADAHLGLAGCLVQRKALDEAARVLEAAAEVEPGNPVVLANQGLVRSDGGQPAAAVAPLERALAIDPDLHQARFALALARARTGDRAGAAREAAELLRRLPAGAPQRLEVERLLSALK